jgi:dUTP diphosphatase
MDVEIAVLAEDEALLPIYSSEQAAGADVRANISEPLVLKSGESRLIPTGIKFSIPEGYEIQVRPRSGLALKHQITVLNSPGTIDSDYRGELCVILINHGKNDFVVEPKMRIAQIIVAPVVRAAFLPIEALEETARGVKGFGHTGLH